MTKGVWDVTLCRVVNGYRRFEWSYYLKLADQAGARRSYLLGHSTRLEFSSLKF